MEKENSAPEFMKKTNLIGQILLKRGLINNRQLEEALSIKKREGGLIGYILVKQGFISEESLSVALASQCGLTYIPIERYKVSKNTVKLVPRELLVKYCFIPLEIIDETLTIVMANPLDKETLNTIQKNIPYKLVSAIGVRAQIENAIKENY